MEQLSFPGYRLDELIHDGATSRVFRGRRRDGLAVVLKVPRPEHVENIARCRWEHELLREIDRPGIVRVHGFERHGAFNALVLEDFGGRSLDRLVPGSQWSMVERLRIALAMTEALEQLHGEQLIHKDLSPANFAWAAETDTLKLLDLGMATRLSRESPAIRNPSELGGTLAYMSPEQTGRVSHELDHRADLYSLGATFYELFVASPPFAAEDPLELVHCHIARQPNDPRHQAPDIPGALADIVLRLLAKAPEDRYQSCHGLKSDLKRCLDELTSRGAVKSFALATEDRSERFFVPEGLYGRSDEVAALCSAFEEAISNQSPALALVTGYSGIGKSKLAGELKQPVNARRGYFVAGKFDQLREPAPYSGFVKALRTLARYWLGESSEQLERRSARLREAVGENGRVVTELVPEVERILGPQPMLPELEPVEAKNRFERTFRRFIRASVSPSQPLVLFLDDLQWADNGSLELLQLLFVDDTPRALFVLGAYRDHEVDPGHPLLLALDTVERSGVRLLRVPLGPLEPSKVRELVADAVIHPVEEEAVGRLASLVNVKTEGNPLFVIELLKALVQDGSIELDAATGAWRWDDASIARRGIADNVVELVIDKLRRLPAATLRAVQVASFLGSSFDLETLSLSLETGETEVFEQLLPAQREGFVATASGWVMVDAERSDSSFVVRDFRFVHDRIQQGAYRTVPESEQASLHLRIGRILLCSWGDDLEGDRRFKVVDQLNHARRLIDQPDERRRLGNLNLEAALAARKAQAVAAAKIYLEAAVGCLDDTSWEEDYSLAYTIYRELAEVEFLLGDFAACEARVATALERARSPVDEADLQAVLVGQLTLRARYADAYEAAIRGLAVLGIELRLGSRPEAQEAEHRAIRELVGNRAIVDLVELPEMTDPAAERVILLLFKVLSPLYNLGSDQFPWAVAKAVHMSLRYGPSAYSADLFSVYGLLLCVGGDYRTGLEWGRLALALAKRFLRPDSIGRCAYHLADFIVHWSCPLRDAEPLNELAFRSALEGGDTIYAGYSLIHWPYNRYGQGQRLEEVAAAIERNRQFNIRTSNQIGTEILSVLQVAIERWLHPADSPPAERWRDMEAELVERCREGDLRMALCLHDVYAGEWFYQTGDIEAALRHLDAAEASLVLIMGHVGVRHLALFRGLSLAATWVSASAEDRVAVRQELGTIERQWHRWADACEENCGHLHALIRAEIARIDDRPSEAFRLYELAIVAARRGGFVQHVALAAERAAEAWLAADRAALAIGYLREAREAYRLWGASRKVEAVGNRLAQWAEEERDGSTPAPGSSSKESGQGAGQLDLASILKASQAISSELKLEPLLVRLVEVVIENAGARSAVLILPGADGLSVEVEARLVEDGASQSAIETRLFSVPVSEVATISTSIVHYVERSRETVILGNATESGSFVDCADIVSRQPKSVLCLPMSSQGRLVAMLYLENDLIPGAFTTRHLEVLQMLSSQIAISLENALLYREIEERVAQRTQELEERNVELRNAIDHLHRTQDQLVHSEKMAALGRFTLGVAHEIKNPLNLVSNFAGMVADLSQRLVRAIGDDKGPASTEALLADLELSASKVREHSRRADGIIQGMLHHATGQGTGEVVPVELGAVIDDVLQMARLGSRVKTAPIPITLEVEHDPELGPVPVVPHELGRVLVNLIENAIDALYLRWDGDESSDRDADDGPRIVVSTRREASRAVIRIRDNGAGIKAEAREHIFEPFFTTKPPGSGVGLGLSQCHDTVTQILGGSIRFESTEGSGTVFEIFLPRTQASVPPMAPESSEAADG